MRHLPTPRELGLPEKFVQWRPAQEDMIDFMQRSTSRIMGLCAGTGEGKTGAYIADALIRKIPTCVVTDSRALQDQLMRDFETVGMVDLRGRRNYRCKYRPDTSCEEGYQGGCLYRGTIACPSSQAEMRAASSQLVVTSYAKWTAAKKYGTGMSHFQRVIFDEGHKAPDALAAAMSVIITNRDIDLHCNGVLPADLTSLDLWRLWAMRVRRTVEEEANHLSQTVRRYQGTAPSHLVRQALHLKYLLTRLFILSTMRPSDWVLERGERGFQFDPIRPGRYAEGALLMRIPSVLFVSATLRPKTLYLVGQGADSFTFKEIPSQFDPLRCPIYWVPTMRVDKRQHDLSQLWMRLDQIAARRRDRKGIVHTVSYARREEVTAASRFASSMFLNARGEAPTALIDQFRSAGPGAILVSPAVGAGFDFPGRDCEWQLLCKIPFPPPSQIMKARTEDDKEFPYYLAMQTLVQTFGRGMRSATDRCENFIADDHMEWFFPRYKHLAPISFHRFYRRAEVLPQPPEPL